MDKLIKTIQEEINQLMNSKIAKFTDKQLSSFEKSRENGLMGAKYGILATKSQSKKVDKFDLHGNYVETYNSISDASRSVNRDDKAIRQALQGISKTCGGFIWKYKN